jgi:AcrR family transcriptional regulator
MDAVAQEAGVARMTVYHQFGSKRELLEALFDHLASGSLVARLRPVFAESDPQKALVNLIDAFAGFWTAERKVLRHIRALGVLDADFKKALHDRDERRRRIIREILTRIERSGGKLPFQSVDDAVNLVWTLTSFETFDALAGSKKKPSDVAPLIRGAIVAILADSNCASPKSKRKQLAKERRLQLLSQPVVT